MVLPTACTATDTEAEAQTDRIETYLRGLPRYETTNPLMLGDSLYMVTDDGIYKYFGTENDDSSAPRVQTGDSLSIWFDIRTFVSGPGQYPLYTNITDLVEEYGMTEWPDEAMTITVGEGQILKSIDNALPLCREGSDVIFIIPSDKLFDDETAGMIPVNTAVMYRIIIEKINPE